MQQNQALGGIHHKKKTLGERIILSFKRDWLLYLMVLPLVTYYLIFHLYPMWGAQIAFRSFNFNKGITGSRWVGLANFRDFFSSIFFGRLLRNTLLISFYNILFGFPIPVILALMLNEVRSKKFKSIVQTTSYLPHFLSLIVACSIISDFFSRDGVFTYILSLFGLEQQNYMLNPQSYRAIYTFSTIWQQSGWNSIVFLAALSGIDESLYEASRIDGAGRLRQICSITLPSIAPTIIVMLILKVGWMMDMGSEKTLLLYNAATYETGDIIASYVYRKGLVERNYSYSAAVELFNSVINLFFLLVVNQISKKTTDTSLF